VDILRSVQMPSWPNGHPVRSFRYLYGLCGTALRGGHTVARRYRTSLLLGALRAPHTVARHSLCGIPGPKAYVSPVIAFESDMGRMPADSYEVPAANLSPTGEITSFQAVSAANAVAKPTVRFNPSGVPIRLNAPSVVQAYVRSGGTSSDVSSAQYTSQ
jgi:hypothetical protein